MCKPSECVYVQEFLVQTEAENTADLVLSDCIEEEKCLSNDSSFLGAITKSKSSKSMNGGTQCNTKC